MPGDPVPGAETQKHGGEIDLLFVHLIDVLQPKCKHKMRATSFPSDKNQKDGHLKVQSVDQLS